MFFSRVASTSFILACAAVSVSSQDSSELLPTPVERWSVQLLPQAEFGSVEVQKGNGIFVDPSGRMAIVTTVGATVYAFGAYSGTELWKYQTPSEGTSAVACHSAVTFSPTEGYMAFTVVDNENSLSPTTRVVALDMDGNELWVSDALNGIPQGDPLISSDGGYIFLTHNEFDQETTVSTAYFTILTNSTGMVFYSEPSDADIAFGPPGIFHMPVAGNYDPIVPNAPVSEGENNVNDFLMWSQTPKPSDTSIGTGFLFGFQFPRTFNGENATDIGFFQLGEIEQDFQSTTPPVITNQGLSAYWGVTRSQYVGWTDKRFTRGRSSATGFERNADFPGEAVFASPSLSNDGPDPIIFGGTASNQFIRMTVDFESIVVATEALILSRSIVDGDERAVYYVESNGNLHQADVENLADIWNYTINFAVEGEMALTPNNDVLIVADRRGVIRALEVAEIAITDAPSEFPSDMPSMAPSGGEIVSPPGPPVAAGSTSAPSAAPGAGSPAPDGGPGPSPTSPPSAANHPKLVYVAVASIASLMFWF